MYRLDDLIPVDMVFLNNEVGRMSLSYITEVHMYIIGHDYLSIFVYCGISLSENLCTEDTC